jgi:hypothetical protein
MSIFQNLKKYFAKIIKDMMSPFSPKRSTYANDTDDENSESDETGEESKFDQDQPLTTDRLSNVIQTVTEQQHMTPASIETLAYDTPSTS